MITKDRLRSKSSNGARRGASSLSICACGARCPHRVDLLSVAEFIALRDAAAPHLAWMMEVAYHTGARVGPYDIRHLHITYALAMGADIEELAKRVGHTSTRMIVNVYSHLAKDLIQEKAFVLPDISKKRATVTVNGMVDERKGPLD